MENLKTKENSGLGFYISYFGTVLILLWLGTFKFTPHEAEGIVDLIKNHPLTFWAYDYFTVQQVSNFVGASELIIAVLLLISLKYKRVYQLAGLGLVGMFAMTLSYLFTTPGMFRVVDGLFVTNWFVLKDIMYLGFAFTVLSLNKLEFVNWKISPKVGYYISMFGTAIILLWLGLYKFTPHEAKAIAPLISSHPLTFWAYDVFSIQQVSNFVGSFELIVVALMIIGLKFKKVNLLAGLGLLAIFLMTVSYIFTAPHAFNVVDGIFIPNFNRIKDIMYLGFAVTFFLSNYASYKKS